jgi:pimeloyl-ACP methyl ester carboxylesterase
MSRVSVSTGVELEYETMGSPSDPPLLLVMGFTAQLTAWPDDFCHGLADAGHYVIRFDNRDCGLSTKFDGVQVDLGAVMTAALSEQTLPPVPYTLSEMAADSVALLDALGIASAHIVGASMGGMIVQHMAIEHPTRVRSLCSVMSTTGEPEYGQPAGEAMSALLSPPPTDREGYIDSSSRWMIWASKKYGDPAEARRRAARDYDRSFYPEGAGRQMAAIFASGRRADGLRQLRVPTLVIHGRDDTLISPSGGVRTAELIDGAHLFLVADMGHDLPSQLNPLYIDLISSHTGWADSVTKGS